MISFIYDIISDDLFANGQYLSVENINKLKLVSDDMTKLISKGFDDKFKSALTDVVNVDGLMLDRDYEVLSGDDLALVKTLSNEYLYYEQERNEPVMKALAYEVVKIRQKAIYYDQYNRGPYLNKEGYEGNIEVGIKITTLGLGDVYFNGGKTEDTAEMDEARKEVSIGAVGNVFDFLLFFARLDDVQRAKAYLEIGDIWVQISDNTYTSGEERHSWYKRDGKYIASTRKYLNASNPPIPSIINPDLELESKWEMFKEYLKEKTEDKLLDIVQKGISKNIK